MLLLAEPGPPDEYADEFRPYPRRHTTEASDGEYTFHPWPNDGFRSTTGVEYAAAQGETTACPRHARDWEWSAVVAGVLSSSRHEMSPRIQTVEAVS